MIGPALVQAPRIAAASDLKFALDDIVAVFKRDTGLDITPVYGSSGNFRQQIAQGAPFEMFMSADEAFVFDLAGEGRTVDRGELYAIGRIVLFAPHGSPLEPDAKLADLKAALADGRIARFAIANPEHEPRWPRGRAGAGSSGIVGCDAAAPRARRECQPGRAVRHQRLGAGRYFRPVACACTAGGEAGNLCDDPGGMARRTGPAHGAGSRGRGKRCGGSTATSQDRPRPRHLPAYGFALPGEQG